MRCRRLPGLLLALLVAATGPACSVQVTTPGGAPTATLPPPTATLPSPTATPTSAATPVPRTGGTGKAEVAALWAARRDGRFTGGTSKVQVTIEKNPSRELRVGFFEEEVGGSGPMWKAAGWMAVVMSGFLLGADPTDYRYAYEIGGYADGPSAGGLMTVATLAVLLGHPVRADATMTGTINPDGTIGPVGGIPHKIDGAAAAEKKLVLIPAGQRKALDFNKKQHVDVVELGKQKGVEVREVADIAEAYALLTGKPLPKPEGLRESQPALPAAAAERTRERTRLWLDRYDELARQFQALPPRYQIDVAKAMMDEAARARDKAVAYGKEGLVGGAYAKALLATSRASIAVNAVRAVQAYLTTGPPSAVNRLKTLRPALKIDELLERIDKQPATTLGDVVALADAYGNLSLAMALVEVGDDVLDFRTTNTQAALVRLGEVAVLYGLAAHAIELANDALEIGVGFGKAPAPAPEKLTSLADLFRRAAEANLNYFDSVVLAEVAQELGLHLDVVKNEVARRDSTYMVAVAAARATGLIKKRTRGDTASTYATLGGALTSHVQSSMLVARYYALNVKFDQQGNVTGVENEKALASMLDFAEQRARASLALAASVDSEPVQPILSYEHARVTRDGDVRDKFSALTGYWTATLQGQMLGILTGKATMLR